MSAENSPSSNDEIAVEPPRHRPHPDTAFFSKVGVTYVLTYLGRVQVRASMRDLSFETRFRLTEDCIRRVCRQLGDDLVRAEDEPIDCQEVHRFLGLGTSTTLTGSTVIASITTKVSLCVLFLLSFNSTFSNSPL